MKLFVILSLLVLTLPAWVMSQNYNINLGTNENGLSILSKSNTGLTLKNSISALQLQTKQKNSNSYSLLLIEGYNSNKQNIGKADLPMYNKLIEIPHGASVNVNVISFDEEIIYLLDEGVSNQLYPVQPSYSKSTDPADIIFQYDETYYSTDQFSTEPMAKIAELGYMRETRIGRLSINPFSYNPVKRELKVYNNMIVEISFTDADLALSNEKKSKAYSPFFEKFNSNFLNYSPNPAKDQITTYPIKYIIVANRMFETQLQSFIQWKTRKGFNVITGYTDQASVGTTTTTIKAYIKSFYDNATASDPAPTFVLLVGDVAQIPTFSGTTATHKTDLYYCEYTGDFLPEIYYGRWSATSTAQLQPQIDKTLMYEQYTMPDPSYLKNILLVAGVDQEGGDPSGFSTIHGNGQLLYGINNYFNSAHGITNYEYLYPESDLPASVAAIKADFNTGVAFANYTAHCSSEGWANPSFITSDVPNMTNANKYGLMVGNCCQSNTFNDPACFGEAVLRKANGGAVGYIGGSNYSYWDEDYHWGVGAKAISNPPPAHTLSLYGAYDRAFHDLGEPFSEWYITNAQMMMAGNLAVTEAGDGMANYYWEIYHLMGDPSIMNYFGVPPALTANYNDIQLGQTTLSVTTEQYAYVAISQNNVLLNSIYTGTNTNVTLTFPAFTTAGTADIVITKQNRSPYIGTVDIVAADVAPTANFAADQTIVTAGTTINFTDLSTDNPAAWLWTLPGGTPSSSTAQNPSIVYNTAGVYDVTLYVSNSAGNDTETKYGYITVNPVTTPPVADFIASETNITVGGNINFTDLSTNVPTSWQWTFEGGNPAVSTDQNPSGISYLTEGTYMVTLKATNAFGFDSVAKIDYITVAPIQFCDAGSSATNGEYISNVTVGSINNTTASLGYADYTNLSTSMTIDAPHSITVTAGSPYQADQVLIWIDWNNDSDFDDADENVFTSTIGLGPFTANITPPANATSGNVIMRIRLHDTENGPNATPCDTSSWGEVEDYTITVIGNTEAPIPEFTQNETSNCIGIINFTDMSAGNPTEWLWDFGDGTTSTEQSPVHTYTISGTFTVTLTASNQYGSNQIVHTDLITIDLPAAPLANDATRCGPGTVTITATGSGTLYWYDVATGGTSLVSGTSFTTPALSITTPFYVENHEEQASQNVGNTQSNTNGQLFNNTAEGFLTFDALTTFKLVSVEINAGTTTATRKISLRNSAGLTLDSVIFTAANGVSRVTLDFEVPPGTGHKLVGSGNINLYRNDAGVTFPYTLTDIVSITSAGTSQYPNLTNRYYYFYDWEVKLPDCISERVTANAIITNGVVAGTASASPTAICSGNTSTLTLTGSNGDIQWQQSADGTTGWTDITGATTASYTISALAATSYFRAHLTASGCPEEYSNVISVTVTPGPVGGTATATPASLCSGETSNLVLTGYTGSIQWEQSADGINAWINVIGGSGATTASYTSSTLSNTIYYRAKLSEGTCDDVYSNIIQINVFPLSVAGTASANPTALCSGNSTELTLTGNTGIIQWQQSADGTTGWTDISGATFDSYTTNALSSNIFFRAVVTNGACSSENSNSVEIIVLDSPISGTASANPTSVCTGLTSTILLTGYTGTIQWQDSITGGVWNNVTTGTGATSDAYTTDALSANTFYRAIVSSGTCGTVISNTVSITINPAAVGGTVTANNNPVCSGSNVTLTVSGHTGTIRWQRSTDGSIWTDITGFQGTLATYYAFNLTQTTWFRTKLTLSPCPDAFSNELMIVVNPEPVSGTASASSTDLCTGEFSVLSLTGSTGNIQWQESANGITGWTDITGANSDQYTTNPLTVTSYYRAVLSSEGCTSLNSNTITINVTAGPIAGIAVSDANELCEGSVTNINLSGNTGTIQWEESSDGITWINVTGGSGANTSSYTTPTLSANISYRAKLSLGTCPDVYSNVIEIIVSGTAIAGTATASSNSVCTLGEVAINLSGYAGFIQWQVSSDGVTGWFDIPGATMDSYTTEPLSVTEYYRAVVSSGVCTPANSNVVMISVTPGPVGGTATTDATSLCNGSNAIITLDNYTGTIQWEESSDGITWINVTGGSGENTATYTTANLSAPVYFRAKLAYGVCPDVYSNEIYITIDQPAVAGTASGNPLSICGGNTTTLNLSGHSGLVQWQSSEDGNTWTSITGATSVPFTTAALTSTNYFRAEISSGICTVVYSNSVMVEIMPTALAGVAEAVANPICSSTSATLNLAGYTGNIQWQFSPNGSTSWVNLSGATSSTYNTPNLINAIFYRAVVSLGTCPSHSSNVVQITVDPAPVAGTITSSETIFCGSGSTNLNITGQSGAIQWQDSPDGIIWNDISGATNATFASDVLTSSTYFRAVISSGTCNDAVSNTVVVTVDAEPVAGTASTPYEIICLGDVGTISLSGYTGTIQWQASDDGSNWNDIPGATMDIITGAPTATTYFRAEISNGSCPVVYSNTLLITVNPAITASTTSTDAAIGNNDGTASVNATGGNGTYTYLWDSNAGNQITATATDLYPGTYSVTINDGYCENITSITVNGYQAVPVANFTASTISTCQGTQIAFTDLSTMTPTSWYWIFEGGTPATSTDQNPVVNYDANGIFSVTLIVSNAGGSDTLINDDLITISSPSAIVTSTDETAPGMNDGTASVTASGGTPPYTYYWSNGATTPDISGLTGGEYSVIVFDANGCMTTQPVTIGVGTSVSNIVSFIYAIYPNPSKGNLFVEMNSLIDKIEISDVVGKIIYTNQTVSLSNKIDMHNAEPGVYFIRLYTGEKIKTEKILLVK